MENENRFFRQPVAVSFFSQNTYPEEPLRQIEYEILFVDKGMGSIYVGNSVKEVHAGDFVFFNSFEDHFFKRETSGIDFHCYRILFDISALGTESDPCRNFFEGIRLCHFLKMPEDLALRFIKIAGLKKDFSGRELILRSLLLNIISYAIETEQFERFSQIVENEKRKLSAIDNALH